MKTITEEVVKESLSNSHLEFSSTHHKLSLPIINRIYKKMMNGIKFDTIKVCDNLIIDGHHRYISSKSAQIDIGTTKCPKTSSTQEYKWDTKDKIQYLNELDAEFNNISVDKIIEMTK